MDQEMKLSVVDLNRLLKALVDNADQGAICYVDWTNHHIRVVSASKPTFKRNGERLVLSTGPAFRRDIIDEIAG